MNINRRTFLGGMASATSSVWAQNRKPNIVWIMADDLGVGDLGCYGQTKIATPHIDRLSREGKRFTSAYAGCTVCAPSRSVLMTGLHTGHTPVRANSGGVPLLPDEVTVAAKLQDAGYRTGMFGKWGLGDINSSGAPEKQGFDEYCGYLHQVHAHWFYPEFLYRNGKRLALEGNAEGKRTTYSHDVIEHHALNFIKSSKDKPFFAYLPFTLPHVELLVTEDYLKRYRGKFPERPYIDTKKHLADQPESRAAYAGMGVLGWCSTQSLRMARIATPLCSLPATTEVQRGYGAKNTLIVLPDCAATSRICMRVDFGCPYWLAGRVESAQDPRRTFLSHSRTSIPRPSSLPAGQALQASMAFRLCRRCLLAPGRSSTRTSIGSCLASIARRIASRTRSQCRRYAKRIGKWCARKQMPD
jgi:hypothetical protein